MALIAQDLIVALLVAGCATYAFWTLAPAAVRRRIARRASRTSWLPAAWRAGAAATASASASGCGCDGCDHRQAAPPRRAEQPIVLHRRRPP